MNGAHPTNQPTTNERRNERTKSTNVGCGAAVSPLVAVLLLMMMYRSKCTNGMYVLVGCCWWCCCCVVVGVVFGVVFGVVVGVVWLWSSQAVLHARRVEATTNVQVRVISSVIVQP